MAEEYIKKEDAIQSVVNHDLLKSKWSRDWAEYMLEDAKPADVAPVRHGRWMKTGAYPHRVYCSVCSGTYAQAHWEVWKDGSLARAYCPNCGAKMDEEVDA